MFCGTYSTIFNTEQGGTFTLPSTPVQKKDSTLIEKTFFGM